MKHWAANADNHDDETSRLKSARFLFDDRPLVTVVYNAIVKTLLRFWRVLPMWFHILVMRMYRPKFRASVAAIIFDEQGRILLFKHTYRKFEWGLPAGGLEYNEQPDKAIVREFLEETGMQIEVEKLLLAESSKEDRNISLVYLCKIVNGVFTESSEISEMKYFDVHDLPHMLFHEKNLIRWTVKELKEK